MQSRLLHSHVNIHTWSRILEKFWIESKLCWNLYKAETRHVAGGFINCLLWGCFSASLSYCPACDDVNEPITLLSEVKCSNFLWWWPLPGREPLVRAPVFIGSLVWTVVVKPGGHTGIVARCEVSTAILVKIQSLRECVAVVTNIHRNFGNCSSSDTLSLCRRRASSWLLCDYPTCGSDFLHVGLDITRVTSDNKSVPEAKIWNISCNIWGNERMRHFIFLYGVTPVVGFDLQQQFCVYRKLTLLSVNNARQHKILGHCYVS